VDKRIVPRPNLSACKTFRSTIWNDMWKPSQCFDLEKLMFISTLQLFHGFVILLYQSLHEYHESQLEITQKQVTSSCDVLFFFMIC
jgi:hypothetical protein